MKERLVQASCHEAHQDRESIAQAPVSKKKPQPEQVEKEVAGHGIGRHPCNDELAGAEQQ